MEWNRKEQNRFDSIALLANVETLLWLLICFERPDRTRSVFLFVVVAVLLVVLALVLVPLLGTIPAFLLRRGGTAASPKPSKSDDTVHNNIY